MINIFVYRDFDVKYRRRNDMPIAIIMHSVLICSDMLSDYTLDLACEIVYERTHCMCNDVYTG